MDLKKYLSKIAHISGNRASLNFTQFESLLKEISSSSFLPAPASDRSSLFFKHIQSASKLIYKTVFTADLRRRQPSGEFFSRAEETSTSVDLDFTIKEALETLKTKDESFRSTHSAFSREMSPVPTIKQRKDTESSDMRTVASMNSIHRRPYLNKSVPDSPNTSVLTAPKLNINQKFRDNELDEFLQTERLVQSEASPVRLGMNQGNGTRSTHNIGRANNDPKRGISIKKIEYSKNRTEGSEKKNGVCNARGYVVEGSNKRGIVVRLDNKEQAKQVASPRLPLSTTKSRNGLVSENGMKNYQVENTVVGIKKKHQEIGKNTKTRKIKEDVVEKHREFVCKRRMKGFSCNFVVSIIFAGWKLEWQKNKVMKQ